MVDIATLALRVQAAEVAQANRELTTLTGKAGQAEKATEGLERSTRGATAAASALGKAIGAIGVAALVHGVTRLADSYTRFTNQLKVVGLEGSNLAKVQDQLFQTAQRYGTSLEALGTLYGRLAPSARELGASQADLLKFTNGVAAAIKVQGGDASQAAGALLQLSQALGGGVVRAEEFNSVIEGARPIAQAVADNIDRMGGSVSRLRMEVIEGKVSSEEFFQAFLRGSAQLEEQATRSSLTIGASLQTLNNALGKLVGETDQQLSATQRLSQGITILAANLDKIITALSAVAVFIAGRWIASLVASTTATLAASNAVRAYVMSVAMVGPVSATATAGMTTMAAAGRGVMAVFTSMNAALAVLTAGFVGISSAAMDASADMRALDGVADGVTDTMSQVAEQAGYAAEGALWLGDNSRTATSGVDALGNAAEAAAGKFDTMASAARSAAINALMAKRAEIGQQIDDLERHSRAGRRRNFMFQGETGDIATGWGNLTRFLAGEGASFLTGGRSDQRIEQQLAKARSEVDRLEQGIRELAAANDDAFRPISRTRTAIEQAGAASDKAAKALRDTAKATRELSGEVIKLNANPDIYSGRGLTTDLKGADALYSLSPAGIEENEARIRGMWERGVNDGIRAAMDGDLKGFLSWTLKDAFANSLSSAISGALPIGGGGAGGGLGGIGGLGSMLGAVKGIGAAFMSNPVGWIAGGALLASSLIRTGKTQKSQEKLAREVAAAEEALNKAREQAMEAARELEAAEQQRGDLMVRLARAMSNEAEALRLERERERTALDPANRALFDHVTAWEDYSRALADARSDLSAAYDRERGAIEQTRDRFAAFADTLRQFRQELSTGDLALNDPFSQYGRTRVRFGSVADLAASGQADALAKLPEVAREFLAASQVSSGSMRDYQRDLAAVKRAVEAAEAYAQSEVSVADRQLAALEAQVSGLGIVNQSVLTVAQAIQNLARVQASKPSDVAPAGAGGGDWSVGGANWEAAAAAGRANPFVQAEGHKAVANWSRDEKLFLDQYISARVYGSLSFLDAFWGLNPGTAASFADRYGLPRYAMGGMHDGGLRLVGEQGPEIEATGPARYWDADTTARMMGGDNTDVVAALARVEARLAKIEGHTGRGARSSEDLETGMARLSDGYNALRTTEDA